MHTPIATLERIHAEFGKDNLPLGMVAVKSTGRLCLCACGCGKRWVLHDPDLWFEEPFTELV
jgi:hypothetical protein